MSDYYNKYLKYKLKYFNLKAGLHSYNSDYTDKNNNLYIKFITEKLIQNPNLNGGNKREREDSFEIREPRNKKLNQYLKDFILNLTPVLLDYVGEKDIGRFKEELKLDDKLIEQLNEMNEEKDLDYVNYEKYDKLLESWIADNLKCPCCGEKTLRRYAKNNMPVIDVVCINDDHTFENGVKFFQIKVSNGSLFFGKPYFSLLDKTIHVGSRNFGDIVHSIRSSDSDIEKKILIGYICILYRESTNNLIINKENSFVVLPTLNVYEKVISKKLMFDELDTIDDVNWYFRYITTIESNHQKIEFNELSNSVINLIELLDDNIVSKNYRIETEIINNPLNIFN